LAKGLIFNIEEFAVHDGPGIRKLVFFKGCPLRCSWCHNPEGISFERELMVSYSACIDCGKCKEVCKHDECITCGDCVEACPLRLRRIAGEEYEAKELAKILLKGEDVLRNSGGGITISGGEPLAQPVFLFELIQYLKPVHVAIETSGFASRDIFQRMVKDVDLVLMDVKHTDPVIHKKYTGVDNASILRNLEYLCSSDTSHIIRIPLIPGVNDTSINITNTLELIKESRNLIKVELLPYHHTAGAKYPMVRRKFEPGFDTEKKVNTHKELFSKYNINYSIL
jgi:pyruvate formate lyase activating enzyme